MPKKICELGRPIESQAKPIPKEEYEKLGLDFSLSPEARQEIEEIERLQRLAWHWMRHFPLGAAA